MSGSRLAALRPFEEKKDYLDMRVKNGIEQHRKGFHTLRVVDAQGQPIPGARVSLKQKSHDFFFGGNLFLLGQLADEQRQRDYERAFCHLFNMATLPFYWNGLEPEQGKPRFAADSAPVYRRPPVDLCLDFCDQHGITPKAHCLNYDGWSPDWLPTGAREVRYYLEKRMGELAEHCADRIHGWEVINEVLCSWHKTEFFHDPRVVEWSFETARRYFPNNELIINEASGFCWEQFKDNRTAYYMQIERALSKGAPINEGVYSQKLGVPGSPGEAETAMVRRDIALAKKTGCPVHICHVSTAQSVAALRTAKAEGVPVTAETCPHYFSLTDPWGHCQGVPAPAHGGGRGGDHPWAQGRDH